MANGERQISIPVIILNWNGINDTRECIAALEKQTFRDFIIWLVDNGSAPDEVEQLKKAYDNHPKVKLVFNDHNLGFTAGNNRLLSAILSPLSSEISPQSSEISLQAPGNQNPAPSLQSAVRSPQYVVLLNNDTAPSPQWLEELVRTAQIQEADMVSSMMINYFEPERMDNAGHVLLNTLEVLPLGNDEPVTEFSPQSTVHSPQKKAKAEAETAGACGGAALYSTAMLGDIGIFDERFTNGYEDVELGLRAILCGYKSVYAPGAVVLHKGSRSVNKIRDYGYTLDIQRHIYYITFKLFPWPVILLCLPFMLFRFFAALLINLLALRWKFLRIQIAAVYHLILTDFGAIRKARRNFFKAHRIISTRRILGKMHFFWKYDWTRFRKYILRREKMVFEKY